MDTITYKMKRVWFRLIFLCLPLISLLNTIFPFILRGYANKKLATLKKLYGHADKVTIGLKTLTVYNFLLDKLDVETGGRNKFLSAKKVVITFNRKQLWQGIAEADVLVIEPVYTYIRQEKKPKAPRQKTGITHVNIFPFIASKVEVTNGVIEYIDMLASPLVRLDSSGLHISAEEVSNMSDFSLPAQVNIQGDIYGGHIKATAKINLQKEQPSFDLNFEAENIELNKINNAFEAYGNFTVNTGTLGLFTEIAAADGQFKGYVKPVINNIAIVGKQEEQSSLWRSIKEGLIGTAAKLFENPKEEQLATKIPIEGKFTDANINVLAAIAQTLRNAFIIALTPSIDHEINLNSVPQKNDTK
jgi:hypothetical protein